MCRHGCFDVQINDQGREFVNQLCDELHKLTGVEQRVTSAYHTQANRLVERQNRTIKNVLVKVLEDNHEMWPHIIEGILFAHRVSLHSSTKYSPFMMLYNREPVLPIDVKHNVNREKEGEIDHENQEAFDLEYFDAAFKSATKIITSIKDDAVENIKAAQKNQKRDYDSRHMSNLEIGVDDIALMKNNNRIHRKDGKLLQKWLGPYTVTKISEKRVVTLKNTSGLILNKKYNVANLKHYFQEKFDDTSSTAIRSSNFWKLEMILLYALHQSRNSIEKCETYNSIKSTCRKWSRIVEGKAPRFFREYILKHGNL